MENLHSVHEILLDILIAAGLLELVVIDLVALGIPWFEGEQSVDFLEKLLLNGEVTVHVEVLHHVVDADLGRGHGSDIDCEDVSEHGLFYHVVVTDRAVSLMTLIKEDRQEVVADLTTPDLSKSPRLDGLKELPESLDILCYCAIMG